VTDTGAELRDRGVEAALAADLAGHRMFRQDVEAVLDRLAAAGRPFTADDVRAELSADVQQRMSAALMPAVIRTAARREEIRCVGYTVSARARRHGGVLRVWTGVPAGGVCLTTGGRLFIQLANRWRPTR
jgi:hypothetical protein